MTSGSRHRVSGGGPNEQRIAPVGEAGQSAGEGEMIGAFLIGWACGCVFAVGLMLLLRD